MRHVIGADVNRAVKCDAAPGQRAILCARVDIVVKAGEARFVGARVGGAFVGRSAAKADAPQNAAATVPPMTNRFTLFPLIILTRFGTDAASRAKDDPALGRFVA